MLGVVEGLAKVFYPEASNIVIFVIMAIVLILRPAGLSERMCDMAGKSEPIATAQIAVHPRAVQIQRVLIPGRAGRAAGRAAVLLSDLPDETAGLCALCLGLQPALGYTGLLSFGHAAFFGGAFHFTAHAVKVWGLPPELGILIGVLGAAGLGLIMGAIAICRQGIYFAMITLALAQMFFFFCLQARFTHGEDGIQPSPAARCSA